MRRALRVLLLVVAASAAPIGPSRAVAASPGPTPGSARVVLCWPPTRYDTAELVVHRAADDPGGPLAVRVTGRGVETTLEVPLGAAARLPLPLEARCSGGVERCALVVERLDGAGPGEEGGTFHVVLQSPDTAGVADTLLLTAHDTVRAVAPQRCSSRAVVASFPNLPELPEALSFASVVPVAGRARVSSEGGCAGAVDVELELPEVLTLSCPGAGEDLTGVAVEADAPVLVLSGNRVAPVPLEPGSGLSSDLLLDAAAPAEALLEGSTYLVPPLPRAEAHAGRGDVVRLVAAGTSGVVVRVRDELGGELARELLPGESWDVDTAGDGADRTLRVDADGALLAWHLPKSRARRGTGDPAVVPLVPVQHFTGADVFFQPDGYGDRSDLVVVAEAGSRVTLDGAELTLDGSSPAGTGGPGELALAFAVVPLAEPAAGTGSLHRIESDGAFGAWLLGQGGFKAHGVVAGRLLPELAAGTGILRAERPDALERVAEVRGRAFEDPHPGPLVFWEVETEATLRVRPCGEAACLSW